MNLLNKSALLLLFFAIPCCGQGQNPSGSTPGSSQDAALRKSETSAAQSAASGNKKKPKKVWTNDELSSVSGSVNVVGAASANEPTQMPNSQSKEGRQRIVESYRSQIQQIREQIEAADKRIEQLKNFKGENSSPSGGINPHQGYSMIPVGEQVQQLEDRKKKLQAKIEDIENDARKNGIEPGELR